MRVVMNWIVFALAIALGCLWNGGLVRAHSWYPWECCSSQDCAPAELVGTTNDGQLFRNKYGTVFVPFSYKEWRLSPDGQVHTCVRPQPSGVGFRLLCAFRGADS